MKRTVALVACVAAVVVAAYTGSRLSAKADAPARPAPPRQTRVAILNLRYVIKGYKKYQAFMEEIQKLDKKYVNDLKAKHKKADELQKQLADTTDEDKREQLEKAIRTLTNDVKDITEKAKKDMARRGANEMVRTYKEIRTAATRHAKANKIDLVLHFEGAADKQEWDSPVLIQRQFNVGCCPMYWNDSLDVSEDVLKALNDAFDRSVQATASR